MGYPDNLFLQAKCRFILELNLDMTIRILEEFCWSLKLLCMGLILDTESSQSVSSIGKTFETPKSMFPCWLLADGHWLPACRYLSLCISFKAVPYSTLHTDSSVGDSDQVPYVAKHEVQSELASQDLPSVVVYLASKSFLHFHWKIVTIDANLSSLGGVTKQLSVKGHWSKEESWLQINVLQLSRIKLPLILNQSSMKSSC